MSDISDVLDRFTDPERKRKRQLDKERKTKKKQIEALSIGKLYALDFFNHPIDTVTFKELQPYVSTVPSLDQLVALERKPLFETVAQTNDMSSIFDFFTNELAAKEWLSTSLRAIGWTSNRTGFDPFAVSNCTAELLIAVPECHLMAVKQMRLVVQYLAQNSK